MTDEIRVLVEELAVAGKCSGDTVRRAIRRGELKSERYFGRLVIRREDADAWLAARNAGALPKLPRMVNAAQLSAAMAAEPSGSLHPDAAGAANAFSAQDGLRKLEERFGVDSPEAAKARELIAEGVQPGPVANLHRPPGDTYHGRLVPVDPADAI